MSDNKNATGKSGTAKPNTNADGQLDAASKPSVDPEKITTAGLAEERSESAPENEAATEREEA